MCGICGVVNFQGRPVEQDTIGRMVAQLRHRGPDDEGVFVDASVGIGHTRLSILDLSSDGHQPMIFDDVIISYNGEVYNFQEIREDLVREGYKFTSNSDTEVILKAYHKWGIDAIARFNGMFAFCLYDKRKKFLYLVRDRFGVKPLYYKLSEASLVFASSIRTLRQGDNGTYTLSKEAIVQYLNLLYVPAPLSVFREVMKVRPGHYLAVDLERGTSSVEKYYELDISNQNGAEPISIQQIDDLLQDAIGKRMISDVPVGVFLSGGVDSSIVCAIAARQSKEKINTFSIGYDAKGKFFDETAYAESVATRYGTNHTRLEVDFDGLFEQFDEIIGWLDEPLADTSVFLNYYIASLARKYVTVALSGVGGDELYGGYNRYQAFLIGQYFLRLPGVLQRATRGVVSRVNGSRNGVIPNLMRAMKKTVESVNEDPPTFYSSLISYTDSSIHDLSIPPVTTDLNSLMKFDIEQYLPDDILSLTDQMSMAVALEVREPLLDYRLVEQAMRIPGRKKVSLWKKKIVLKTLAEKYLDKSIIYRRKQGFSAPIDGWLRDLGIARFREMFAASGIADYVDPGYTERILTGFLEEGKEYSLQLYSLLVLAKWLEKNR
jgi:asparagine synthase (glutamine-hydrolysing)